MSTNSTQKGVFAREERGMNAYDALTYAAKQSHVPEYKIGLALDKPASYVSNGKLRGSSPRCNTMADMLAVCGYKLVAVPKETSVPDGLEIDS